jgi:hypothetical protein
MDGACSTHGGEDWAYRVLVGKSEGKGLLGRHRSMWVDNIKMDLEKIKGGLGLD